jgi:hypothetical protein
LTKANPFEIIARERINYGISYDEVFVIDRLCLWAALLERALILAETFTEGVRVSPETVTLKTGEYVWEPERAPEGPLLIVASVTDQVAYVYRNGIRIARSSVSTGRPGHNSDGCFHNPGRGGPSYNLTR